MDRKRPEQWHEGFDAAEAGYREGDNPYEERDGRHDMWIAGFREGKKICERIKERYSNLQKELNHG